MQAGFSAAGVAHGIEDAVQFVGFEGQQPLVVSQTERGRGGAEHVGEFAAFTDTPVRNYADAKTQDTAAFSRFFNSMLNQGVMLPPSAFEAWFLSAAHDDEVMETIIAALPAAAEAAAAG